LSHGASVTLRFHEPGEQAFQELLLLRRMQEREWLSGKRLAKRTGAAAKGPSEEPAPSLRLDAGGHGRNRLMPRAERESDIYPRSQQTSSKGTLA
jgi:hypothetical protein